MKQHNPLDYFNCENVFEYKFNELDYNRLSDPVVYSPWKNSDRYKKLG